MVSQKKQRPLDPALMNETPLVVCPEILALDALINATINNTQNDEFASSADNLLFHIGEQGVFLVQVVRDTVLEPVDKLVWMVLCLEMGKDGGRNVFPTHSGLGKLAGISSRSTISRTLTILRLTRWLSRCSLHRHENKQFRGSVFVLHDEPLVLADTLHLDAHYFSLIDGAQSHNHARVRTVARGVQDTLKDTQKVGQGTTDDALSPAFRASATNSLKQVAAHTYFSFGENVMSRRHRFSTQHKDTEPVQNLYAQTAGVQNVDVRNLDSACCSSVLLKKTTTRKNQHKSKTVQSGEGVQNLVYPRRFSEGQCKEAEHCLERVAPAQRQSILDEVEGRIRAEKKGMNPLYDDLSFLRSLCKSARNGDFKANLGIKVQDERRQSEQVRQRVRARQCKPPESDLERQHRIKAGEASLDKIRNVLGIPCTIRKHDDAEKG